MIGNIFNSILYQPLFNAVVWLYDYIPGHDFGVAIIILTLAIRFILYPLMAQSIKSQKRMSELQPQIQEIQKKYQNDKQEQSRAMMELYKKEKFNPFGGCLPMLVQLPILIALYQVFWRGFGTERMSFLYDFVPHPGVIDPMFFGVLNLSAPNIILAVLAGVAQFFQSKMLSPKKQGETNGQMAQLTNTMQKQMIYFLPLFTVFILWKLPAAIGLYWIATSGFSILQQYIIYRPKKKILS
jgi:YidC/Oxa1 family membrane protein insertase